MTPMTVDQTKILTASEIKAVLQDLKRPSKRRYLNNRQNLVIFRLSTCCGLRASEITGLKASDVNLGNGRPYIQVRAGTAKGKKARRVPLWWDSGTLADLGAWSRERSQLSPNFVSSTAVDAAGKPLTRNNIRNRFRNACKVLGRETTTHHGRHSFVTHSLKAGRSLAEVRDAAGHSNISTTSIYTHVADEDDSTVGEIF